MGHGAMGVPQETYAYAKTLLDVATSSADGRTRALLVGGGIANFTDVAATFKGIIQVRPPRQPLFSMLRGLKNLGSFFFSLFCYLRFSFVITFDFLGVAADASQKIVRHLQEP